ncbi:MAG TPA: glucose-6-phosphate dehydrogenase [Candidatus Binataceae bacterium]|nr:glucose-6-phosphate dehydrogenase [Candidatus Binataceae bacterium]
MASMLSISETHPAPPCSIVILGASGDLARRKLLPALYNLEHCGQGMLPAETTIVGFARTQMSAEEFRTSAREAITTYSRLKVEEECWRKFEERLDYMAGLDARDGFQRLRERLEATERRRGSPPNRIFYLSIPPEAIRDSIERLAEAGLIRGPREPHFSRVVVEKPIGHDLESAIAIGNTLNRFLAEPQIFRIDHYLGKETVQNLLVLRFANTIFERLWGSRNVSHVQITVAESEGVGTRAGYYDRSGALRDMLQNHMLQVLALLAMEPPVSLDADAIRESKLNVLRALRPIRREDAARMTIRARYSAGTIEGKPVRGYLEEKGVAPNSRTETYVALKAFVDNWRWSGVPFYLRTGKRLGRRVTEVAVVFKRAPHLPFEKSAVQELSNNAFVFRIQPDEGITVRFGSKVPNTTTGLVRDVTMDFQYGESFVDSSPEAYERLILDVLLGDPPLFPRHAEVELGWEILDPVLDHWAAQGRPEQYASGGWGPHSSYEMIARDGRTWRRP